MTEMATTLKCNICNRAITTSFAGDGRDIDLPCNFEGGTQCGGKFEVGDTLQKIIAELRNKGMAAYLRAESLADRLARIGVGGEGGNGRHDFERWWLDRKGPGFVGFGRDKKTGDYHAEFARDAWAAWSASARPASDA